MNCPRFWHPASPYFLNPFGRVRSRMQGGVGARYLRLPDYVRLRVVLSILSVALAPTYLLKQ